MSTAFVPCTLIHKCLLKLPNFYHGWSRIPWPLSALIRVNLVCGLALPRLCLSQLVQHLHYFLDDRLAGARFGVAVQTGPGLVTAQPVRFEIGGFMEVR